MTRAVCVCPRHALLCCAFTSVSTPYLMQPMVAKPAVKVQSLQSLQPLPQLSPTFVAALCEHNVQVCRKLLDELVPAAFSRKADAFLQIHRPCCVCQCCLCL